MTDRELLEKAARAAGYTLEDEYDANGLYWPWCFEEGKRWCPLTDDGDALRLLTKLPFRELYVSEIGATVSWRTDGGPHGLKCDEYADEHGGDLNAATRRAIVRAAAAMADAQEGGA